jgi:hypothetical protein
MYLHSFSSYVAAISLVKGCNLATAGELLRGFTDWLYVRNGSKPDSVNWTWYLVESRYPGITRSGRSYLDLTDAENAQLVEDLFNALDAFLAERDHVFVIEVEDKSGANS